MSHTTCPCAEQRLKHPIDHTGVEVHMRVQAGTKPVDDGDCVQVQVVWVSLCSAGAVGLQALLHSAQKEAQRHIECAFFTLQVVANAFGYR